MCPLRLSNVSANRSALVQFSAVGQHINRELVATILERSHRDDPWNPLIRSNLSVDRQRKRKGERMAKMRMTRNRGHDLPNESISLNNSCSSLAVQRLDPR